ncbi:hypothetical protein CDL12_27313 [Handroanthus impetiginosus]|uniref:Phytocyanin domain-containing protein n=1 Tax=Handroanthus impetiginosus TaxID=429701 RepID=A0A2G9G4E1_9LAMI|nr:hypothetical protein CDL12_27313 [Handroanthus impetiginosus]
MGRKVMILLVLMVMIMSGGCKGEVYKVGGSSGWTNNIDRLHYKNWAASKVFHVGDTLLFEYNKDFHNVVRVTHANFNSCNSTAPYATWVTGNDSFTITRPGHFYFICGFPGHCQSGQKVDVRVPKSGPSPAPRPSPKSPWTPRPSPKSPWTPSPSPKSPSPAVVPPAQSPKSGSPSFSVNSSWKLWVLSLVVFAKIAI